MRYMQDASALLVAIHNCGLHLVDQMDVEFCWTSLHFPYIWYMRMTADDLHYVTLDKTPVP